MSTQRDDHDDAPTQVPMRASVNPGTQRNPTPEQLKVRRQQSRRTGGLAQTNPGAYQLGLRGAQPPEEGWSDPDDDAAYELGRDLYDEGRREAWDLAHDTDDEDDDYEDGREAARKDPAMGAHTEADLLRAMSRATPDEQRRLVAELDELRRTRMAARAASMELDLDAVTQVAPRMPYAHHTSATDWLGGTEDVDVDDLTRQSMAQATQWMRQVPAVVLEDTDEFEEQLATTAWRWAGRHGEGAQVAHQAYIAHARHIRQGALAPRTAERVALLRQMAAQGTSTVVDGTYVSSVDAIALTALHDRLDGVHQVLFEHAPVKALLAVAHRPHTYEVGGVTLIAGVTPELDPEGAVAITDNTDYNRSLDEAFVDWGWAMDTQNTPPAAPEGAAAVASRKVRKTAGERRLLTLPWSEVCMHMNIAGTQMMGELVNEETGHPMVQLLREDGTPYSYPITLGEAGWDGGTVTASRKVAKTGAVTADALNNLMEFEHVIRVHPDGSVTDAEGGIWAPELHDDNLDTGGKPWRLMNGYSGQDRYSGPVMHNSEFIGGQMAEDILANPGLYVAIVANWSPEEGDESDEGDIEGWAVAYILDDGSRHLGASASRKTAGDKEMAGGLSATASLTKSAARPLYEIAKEIRRTWPKVYFGAVPYLDAMGELDSIKDMYYQDSAKQIVAYFLSNSSTWRGDDAKRIKAELKDMLSGKTAGVYRPVGPGWDALTPGQKIRIGFEENAEDGVFVRIEQNSNPDFYGDTPVIVYTDAQGREKRYLPTGGESPRAAKSAFKTAASCSCAHYDDGSASSLLCPIHADHDPCVTIAEVTGGRRKGSIVNGVCTNCGWGSGQKSASKATQAAWSDEMQHWGGEHWHITWQGPYAGAFVWAVAASDDDLADGNNLEEGAVEDSYQLGLGRAANAVRRALAKHGLPDDVDEALMWGPSSTTVRYIEGSKTAATETCPRCGGNNDGNAGRCAHCGGVLSGEDRQKKSKVAIDGPPSSTDVPYSTRERYRHESIDEKAERIQRRRDKGGMELPSFSTEWSSPTSEASRSAKTAASAQDEAVTSFAKGERDLKVGDRVGEATVTEVGTHTVQFAYDNGYSGAIQIPFVGPMGEEYPSFDRAQWTASRKTAGAPSDVCPQCGAQTEAWVVGGQLHAECPECGWRGTKTKPANPEFKEGAKLVRVSSKTASRTIIIRDVTTGEAVKTITTDKTGGAYERLIDGLYNRVDLDRFDIEEDDGGPPHGEDQPWIDAQEARGDAYYGEDDDYYEASLKFRGSKTAAGDLFDAANAAYKRIDQAWFDALSNEDLLTLWAAVSGENFLTGTQAYGWDDEVYDALFSKGYDFEKMKFRGSKQASDRDLVRLHAYDNGDPIGGGWGPKDVPCKVCGGPADDPRHMFRPRGASLTPQQAAFRARVQANLKQATDVDWNEEKRNREMADRPSDPEGQDESASYTHYKPKKARPGQAPQMGSWSSKTAMPNPVDLGVKVGDIFYSSWGYDQTNVEFYEVVRLTGASVVVREVAQQVERSSPPQDYVVPVPGDYIGPEMTKRIQNGGPDGKHYFTVNSSASAWLWDGRPKYQTSFGWGH